MAMQTFSLWPRWQTAQSEGTGGAFVFVFDLSRASADGVSYVLWQVEPVGAHPAGDDDFVAGRLPGGTLVFGSGELEATFVVSVASDRRQETDETFRVLLAPVGGGVVQGADLVLTVEDDDLGEGPGREPATILGGAADDTLVDSAGPDVILGQGGADSIASTRRSSDVLYLDTLVDTVFGGDGDDTVSGYPDSVFGERGNDSIDAPEAGTVDGGAGADTSRIQSYTHVFFDPSINGYVALSPGSGQAQVLRSVEWVSYYWHVHSPIGTDTRSSVEARAGIDGVVHRFYNEARGVHFFTGSNDEAVYVRDTLPVFNDEGLSFRTAPDGAPGSTSVYRFYNAGKGCHFYTAVAEERDLILHTWPEYAYEGVAYQAYAEDGGPQEELYRFYNTATGAHFFTTSEAERDYVRASFPQFNDEGVAFHVDPL